MSKNFDQLDLAAALTGVETTAVNQNGVTKRTTINMIKTAIGTAFEAAGAVAAGIANHLSAYDHAKITHTNRTALDAVSGTNTGDQDLSALAPKNLPSFNLGIKLPNANNSDGSVLDWYNEVLWNPVDNSGAGLTLTSTAKCTRIGNVVFVRGTITYPTTSSTASVVIGGLSYGTSIPNQTLNITWLGDAAINSNQVNSGVPNNALSGQTLIVNGWYMV